MWRWRIERSIAKERDGVHRNTINKLRVEHAMGDAKPTRGFVTPTVADVFFVGKMADGDLVRSPPIPA